MGFINVVATYAALKLMDSTARRTLLLWSASGMLVSSLLIVLALLGYTPKLVTLGATMAFVSFYEIGIGPIPWLIVAEMFDAKNVATASKFFLIKARWRCYLSAFVVSISSVVNWACNFLVGLLFPYMQEYLGPLSFLPFSLVLVLTIIFILFFLPETHGRSVEQIHSLISLSDEKFQEVISGVSEDLEEMA